MISKIKKLIRFNLESISFKFKDSYKFPKACIVVPLYNEEKFVLETLKSIQKQGYKNFECIVVNDCSTDNSVSIVERFIKKDERFTLLHHDVNSGLAAARNTGVKNCTSEFITFLDSDDFLLRDSLWRRMIECEKISDVKTFAGVFSGLINCQEAGLSLKQKLKQFYPFNVARPEKITFLTTRGECPFPVHAAIIKTEVVRIFNGFDETLRHGAEDWDFWQKVLRHGYSFKKVTFSAAAYRQKSSSMVRTMAEKHADVSMSLISKAYNDAERLQDDTPYFYDKGLSYYELVQTKSKRLLQFASMAACDAGDLGVFKKMMSEISKEDLFSIDENLCVNEIIKNGIKRYYCIGESAFERSEVHKQKQTELREAFLKGGVS